MEDLGTDNKIETVATQSVTVTEACDNKKNCDVYVTMLFGECIVLTIEHNEEKGNYGIIFFALPFLPFLPNLIPGPSSQVDLQSSHV